MTLDMDKERREFEAWLDQGNRNGANESMWKAWLAAKRSMSTQEAGKAEPVARVTGYFSGRCVIEPLQKSLVLPVDMALYAAPINADAMRDAALGEAVNVCIDKTGRFCEAMNGTAAYGARECEKAIRALQSSKQEEKGAGE